MRSHGSKWAATPPTQATGSAVSSLADAVVRQTNQERAARGLGELPSSGLKIRSEFSRFDAELRFDIEVEPTREHAGCRCGDVLRGVLAAHVHQLPLVPPLGDEDLDGLAPLACPLFDRVCTPENPVGPCMVSSEGSCAAYWRFRD